MSIDHQLMDLIDERFVVAGVLMQARRRLRMHNRLVEYHPEGVASI